MLIDVWLLLATDACQSTDAHPGATGSRPVSQGLPCRRGDALQVAASGPSRHQGASLAPPAFIDCVTLKPTLCPARERAAVRRWRAHFDGLWVGHGRRRHHLQALRRVASAGTRGTAQLYGVPSSRCVRVVSLYPSESPAHPRRVGRCRAVRRPGQHAHHEPDRR